MRIAQVGFALGIAGLAMPIRCDAQYRAQSFESWEPTVAATIDLHLSDSRPPNYGLTGGLVGGVVGAVLGGLGGHALCFRYSGTPGDSCTGATVAGGLVGAAIVGLIGYGFGREVERGGRASIPFAPATRPRDSSTRSGSGRSSQLE